VACSCLFLKAMAPDSRTNLEISRTYQEQIMNKMILCLDHTPPAWYIKYFSSTMCIYTCLKLIDQVAVVTQLLIGLDNGQTMGSWLRMKNFMRDTNPQKCSPKCGHNLQLQRFLVAAYQLLLAFVSLQNISSHYSHLSLSRIST